MARRVLVALLAAAALLAPASAARAGSYAVLSCQVGAGFAPNNAWRGVNVALTGNPIYTAPDTSCLRPGDVLAARVARVPVTFGRGVASELVFSAPAGTWISDFDVVLRHLYTAVGIAPNPSNTMFVMATLGAHAYSLAGQYSPPVIAYVNKDRHYWGAAGPIDRRVELTKASAPNSTGLETRATSMTMFAGCWTGRTANCTLNAASRVQTQLIGSRVTISDPVAPTLAGPAAGQGLLAPGLRSGSEPVAFSASDNTGIRRAEIVDVTDPSHPDVVAAKDYGGGAATPAGARCDYSRPRPCPDVANDTVAAPVAIGGHRTLELRVTDAAGNETVSPPFPIVARGALNGVNGGDGAHIGAGFLTTIKRGKGRKRHKVSVLRSTRLISLGKSVKLLGRLTNARGLPIARADLRVLVREERLGAFYVDRGGVSTDDDGHFVIAIPKGPSRSVLLGYRAFTGDDGFAATSISRLRVRPRISIRGPRHVGIRHTATFRGRLRGRPYPPRGVALDLQIFQPGRGWRVFAATRTHRKGRFTVGYRFNSAVGGRFRFRVRMRTSDAYPYARAASRSLSVRVG